MLNVELCVVKEDMQRHADVREEDTKDRWEEDDRLWQLLKGTAKRRRRRRRLYFVG